MSLALPNPKVYDYPEVLKRFTEEKPLATEHHPEAMVIREQAIEYLKRNGLWDQFAKYASEFGNAIRDRYKEKQGQASRGAAVFDRIAGIYPLEMTPQNTEEFRELPSAIQGSLRGYIGELNKRLISQTAELKESGKAPMDKPNPHVYLKDGDLNYIYIADEGNPESERVYKKIGKFLSARGEDDLLKEYREWKNSAKMALSQDVKLVISTNPADVVRKSTSQWWESKSCERLGGGYSGGVWQDIAVNNAIAYVTVDGSPAWIGRFMLRWCDIDEGGIEGDGDFGIEPVFYGDKTFEDAVRKKLQEIGEDEGFLQYTTCKTPYVYRGWSDQMGKATGGGNNKKIIYGEVGAAALDEEIDAILKEWKDAKGYLMYYGDYTPDELDYLIPFSDDMSALIEYDLEEFASYAREGGYYEEGLPYNWEEDILHGYLVQFDITPDNIQSHFDASDYEKGDFANFPDNDKFALWWSYVHGNLLRRFFQHLRKHKLDTVYFQKTKKSRDTTESGIYDITLGIDQECLNDKKCDVYEKAWYELGSPMDYKEINWFESFASYIASFVKCVESEEMLSMEQNRRGATAEEKQQNAEECFDYYLRDIGGDPFTLDDRSVDQDGGLFPLFTLGGPEEFAKKYANIDFDLLCKDILERGMSVPHLNDICMTSRPIEKFWE